MCFKDLSSPSPVPPLSLCLALVAAAAAATAAALHLIFFFLLFLSILGNFLVTRLLKTFNISAACLPLHLYQVFKFSSGK